MKIDVIIAFIISFIVVGVIVSEILNVEQFASTMLAQTLEYALPVIGIFSFIYGLYRIIRA